MKVTMMTITMVVILVFSGCSGKEIRYQNPTGMPTGMVGDSIDPSDSIVNQTPDQATASPVETQRANTLSGKSHEIEGLVASSFEELESKKVQKKEWLRTFTREACIYKLRNVSDKSTEFRITVAEPFVEVFYENDPEYGKIQFFWWADAIPEQVIQDLESNGSGLIKRIEYKGTKYYYNNPPSKEAGDNSPLGEQWVDISWVEDNRYFNLRITAPKFDMNMLNYCQVEKIPFTA